MLFARNLGSMPSQKRSRKNSKATFTVDDVKDSYAVGGVDLSSTTDLTAATLLVRKGEDIYCLQHYWIPEELAAKRENEDKVPYSVWENQGLITFTPGPKVRFSDVTKWFIRMRDEYRIYPMAIGYDPWSSAYWVDEMLGGGFALEPVRQGAQTMSGPMKSLKADLTGKILNYGNNPLTKWCMLLKVDNMDITSMVSIDGLAWTESDIHSEDSGRDLDGTMHVTVIDTKAHLSISCVALNQTNAGIQLCKSML